jgi:hypothetical protein
MAEPVAELTTVGQTPGLRELADASVFTVSTGHQFAARVDRAGRRLRRLWIRPAGQQGVPATSQGLVVAERSG